VLSPFSDKFLPSPLTRKLRGGGGKVRFTFVLHVQGKVGASLLTWEGGTRKKKGRKKKSLHPYPPREMEEEATISMPGAGRRGGGGRERYSLQHRDRGEETILRFRGEVGKRDAYLRRPQSEERGEDWQDKFQRGEEKTQREGGERAPLIEVSEGGEKKSIVIPT